MKPIRINKYIADAGFCSRREADKLVEDGRVTVNGIDAQAGTKVEPTDKVRVDGEILHKVVVPKESAVREVKVLGKKAETDKTNNPHKRGVLRTAKASSKTNKPSSKKAKDPSMEVAFRPRAKSPVKAKMLVGTSKKKKRD